MNVPSYDDIDFLRVHHDVWVMRVRSEVEF